MAGPVLWLLQKGFRAERFDHGCDLFRVMANNGHDFLRRKRQASAHNTLHQRAAARGMQNFCEGRFEPRALACGEYHDHSIFVRHG